MNKTKASPTTTIISKILLKDSGRRSNPREGESREKKISGPPNASINDCDSSPVVAEIICFTFVTVRLYDGEVMVMSGTSGVYWKSPSCFSCSFTFPVGLRGSNKLRLTAVIRSSMVAIRICLVLIPARVEVTPKAVTGLTTAYVLLKTTGLADSRLSKLEKLSDCSGRVNAVKPVLSIMPSYKVNTPNSIRRDFLLRKVYNIQFSTIKADIVESGEALA
mmetsp:Transcript_30533/g.34811  ORF Transcript_30533/g.34811 Transcript_30533/m.34811 type:complete len:220 (-) Transcript_30533:2425-3084(-)